MSQISFITITASILILGFGSCAEKSDFSSGSAKRGSKNGFNSGEAQPVVVGTVEVGGEAAAAADPEAESSSEPSKISDPTRIPDEDPNASPSPSPSSTPTPTPCEPSETLKFEETQSQLKANIMDLYTSLQPGANGAVSKQIFAGQSFAANDKVYLVSAAGSSIHRIYPGDQWAVSCSHVAGADGLYAWYVYFKDASGQIINGSSGPLGQINDYTGGVMVPAGAASAWIGFRDSKPTNYDDNEGFRTAPSGSTKGCTFNFKVVTVHSCQ